ncbi:MAG: hypothetical protein AVDCRST_MAG62-305, partial [uncultured Sphingomonas sp.]
RRVGQVDHCLRRNADRPHAGKLGGAGGCQGWRRHGHSGRRDAVEWGHSRHQRRVSSRL